MTPQAFLAVVLPPEGHGLYCAANLQRKTHKFTPLLTDLSTSLDKLTHSADLSGILNSKEAGAFFALATYETALSRKAANVSHLRCIYIDIDCGGGDKCYTTKKEGVAALLEFMRVTGLDQLGMPWLVDSGGGVHVYFPFHDAVIYAEWLVVAKAVKATAARLGFRIDMTVTDDAARVLRVPDSKNYKLGHTRPVTLKQEGSIFDHLLIQALMDAPAPVASRVPAVQHVVPDSPLMQALTQHHATYFKDILIKTVNGSGCEQLAHYIENAVDEGMEPLWRAHLSIAQKCEDGAKACERLSKMHPYDMERMHAKLDTILGPYACTKFDTINPGVCTKCRHWGRVTNPLALGRRVLRAGTPEPTETVDDGTGAAPAASATASPNAAFISSIPVPPYSFFYGTDGALYRSVDVFDKKGAVTETKDIKVLPYTFYMESCMQELAIHTSRFVAIRGGATTHVAISNENIGSQDMMIKELARQNIIASVGKGNDVHLYAYVRAQMEHASSTNTVIHVPPRYGWQPDGGFAVGNTVIGTNGDYTFSSDKLQNLIQSTETKGTLEGWQAYVKMCQDKRLTGVLAGMLTAFASPLMEWVGVGTPAMVIHACHEHSGYGKTTSLHLAASVWGDPSSFPVRPATSERTMLQRAGMLGNLPLLVDEITSVARADKNFLPTLVYNYAQGGHKLKGSGSGNKELSDDLFWRALAYITSNEPLMEKMLAARDTTSFGEIMRVLEWHPTEAIVWSDAERTLKYALSENYGVAGRIYAKWLVENKETAQEVLAQVTERWRLYIGASDVERFWTSGVGALLAAATLCGPKYANIFPFDTVALSGEYARWVGAARTLIGNNVRNAVDLLNAYTREFHGQFIKFDRKDKDKGGMALFSNGESPNNMSARGRIAGRIEYNINRGWIDYYIDVSTMKRYVSERNISYEGFKKELFANKDMVVKEQRKDLLARTSNPELVTLCLCISKQITDDSPPE
jgi:hypothetical protein